MKQHAAVRPQRDTHCSREHWGSSGQVVSYARWVGGESQALQASPYSKTIHIAVLCHTLPCLIIKEHTPCCDTLQSVLMLKHGKVTEVMHALHSHLRQCLHLRHFPVKRPLGVSTMRFLQAASRTPSSAQRIARRMPETEPAWGMRARRTSASSQGTVTTPLLSLHLCTSASLCLCTYSGPWHFRPCACFACFAS